MINLKKLRQIGDKATEGPWEHHNYDVMEKPHVVAPKLWDGKSHCDGSFDIPCTYENAEFIAEARNNWTKMLDALEEAKRLIQSMADADDVFEDDMEDSYVWLQSFEEEV